MASAALQKAKARVQLTGRLLFVIQHGRFCMTLLLIFFSLWIACNNGGDNGNWSAPKCPGAKPMFSIIPNMNTLTADGNTWLAISTCVISILILTIGFLQCISPNCLMTATKPEIKATLGFRLLRAYLYTQVAHMLCNIFLIMMTYNVPELINFASFLFLDSFFISIINIPLCFVHQLMSEYRNLITKNTQAQGKETVPEKVKELLTRDCIMNMPMY